MRDSISEICNEWARERNRHPSFGEGMGEDGMQAIWDGVAETYSDSSYSEIADSIVKDLVSDGMLSKDVSLMDIGCGPGTYAFRMHPYVERIVCVDGSQRMIDRLNREAGEKGVHNIEPILCDCRRLPRDLRCDIVFSSLCPPMNYPDMIVEMEKHARTGCAYVSSASVGTGIETEIWNELGKDYSYGGYNTSYPSDFLKSIGRRTKIRFYEQDYNETVPADKCAERFLGKISKYRNITEREREAVKKVVDRHEEDGAIHISSKNRFGLLTWSPQ